MRLDRGRVSIRVMLIQTGKVSITPALKVESSVGLEDHAFVLGALEVSNNHLESSGMQLFGTVVEATHLADGEGDVGMGIGGEIQEHTKNRGVVELFLIWLSVRVNAEGGSSSRVSIRAAVFHASS